MSNKSFIYLFICIIIDIIESIDYNFVITDERLKSSSYIIPVISEKGFLYIVSGDTEGEDKYRTGQKTYNRVILKFDINSGDLIHTYFFWNISKPFLYGESIMIGNNSEYLLTSTLDSIEIWENFFYAESEYKVFSPRRFIKQIGDSFFYGFVRKNIENYMQILRMQLLYDDSKYFKGIEIKDISNNINVMKFEDMVSCDLTEDKENILCVYISEDLFFYISVIDKKFNFLLNEKKESWNENILNYFMKIVYFKDNSKFIIINSQSFYIARLRFYKYVNKELINQLSPIVDSNSQYLDVDETQLDGYYYSNDIIVADSDKIFKIYAANDKIILTIFQFYNNDTLLHVKIYKMNEFNNFGLNSFSNPRIAMFRNSLLICLKFVYKRNETTGYLFLNYPKSIDISLKETSNTIKIKNLISIENNLFSLNLKFRILKIPKDFIFISKLKSHEVKEKEDLENDDELILKQYRINEGPYKFKYEGISIGNDLTYSSSKIYPKGKNAPLKSDIFIEGRQGEIAIDFKQCLDGHFRLYYDLNLCINYKPEGYYIDENDKILKICEPPCKECYGAKINYTHMNCQTCQDNYFITEDTNSCYNSTPDHYYFDKDIYKRCHNRCLKCITGSEDDNNMNCLECIYEENIFYKRDTHNCIFPNEFKKRDIPEIKTQTSKFFYVFFAILILSIFFTVIITSCCCCKENNNGMDYTEIRNRVDQSLIEMMNLVIND